MLRPVVVQILPRPQVVTADEDLPLVRQVQCGEEVEEGRLATAGRPHDRHELTRLDPEVHPDEGVDASVLEALAEAARVDGWPLIAQRLHRREPDGPGGG